MTNKALSGGRLSNVFKNSTLGLAASLLPSILRFFSRYVFVVYFSDTLLGINSLFSDVVMLFSFADMGVFSAISFFLYKPIAQGDTERIQSLLSIYRKINRLIMILMSVIGLALIPFLHYIKTTEVYPELWIYYLVFLIRNVISYALSYRVAYITAAQKAYRISFIDIILSLVTVSFQIVVTIVTRNFILYLLTDLLFFVVRLLWTNWFILTNYPECRFNRVSPLDTDTRKQFIQKTKSLFLVKIANLGISQTDSIIVSTMLDVVQWGYVSNYLAIKKIAQVALSAFSTAILPSLGNLTAVESREKQMEAFQLYCLFNAWLYLNFFAGSIVLVPSFISLIFGTQRMLDDLTCFLLFFNVLYNGLLEAVTVLRDARGLYEIDLQLTVAAFTVNLIASILLVLVMGLPGVFAGTLICTTIMYGRPYLILHKVYGCRSAFYYRLSAKTVLQALLSYLVMHFGVQPSIWNWHPDLIGLAVSCCVTVLLTNLIFLATNLKNPNLKKSLLLLFGAFHVGRAHSKSSHLGKSSNQS